jgi:surfeit locus 1 family protein
MSVPPTTARRFPWLVSALVLAAIGTMVALGIWQIQRMAWKEALLADYAAASGKPVIAWPSVPVADSAPLFRRSSLNCLKVTGWRAASGRNRDGRAGWIHIASCQTGGGEGPGAHIVAGWSNTPAAPKGWTGGPVSGTIAPDTRHIIRLIADRPLAPGLASAQPPSPEDIPNNHWAYAVQWFLFAAIAAIIFGIAFWQHRAANIGASGLANAAEALAEPDNER